MDSVLSQSTSGSNEAGPDQPDTLNELHIGKLSYLGAADLRLAASLLFQAYQQDPVFREIFNANKEGYEQRLRAAIREELNSFWHSGQPMFGLYAGETLEGIVCLNHVDAKRANDRYWHWRLKMLLTAGYLSTKQMLLKERKVAEAVAYDDYLMLSFIAVHPRYQHKGLGHLLMNAVKTLLAEKPAAQGVVALATRPEYEAFLAREKFSRLTTIEVGQISGCLMVLPRDKNFDIK